MAKKQLKNETKMIESEVWIDVPGYEGFYQVSNLGKIKSIAVRRCIRGNVMTINREKIMEGWDNGHGYLAVTLSNNGKRKNFYIHRLVAECFIGKPEELNYVNHIDCNRRNNCADNLEWCTQKENVNHSAHNMRKPKTGTVRASTGEKYIRARGNKYELAIKVFKYYRTFNTLEEAIAERDKFIARHSDYYKEVV